LNISYRAGAPRVHLRSLNGGCFNLVQLRRLAVATTLILTLSDFLYLTASDKVGQTDTA
jgi:hypothetical protein